MFEIKFVLQYFCFPQPVKIAVFISRRNKLAHLEHSFGLVFRLQPSGLDSALHLQKDEFDVISYCVIGTEIGMAVLIWVITGVYRSTSTLGVSRETTSEYFTLLSVFFK